MKDKRSIRINQQIIQLGKNINNRTSKTIYKVKGKFKNIKQMLSKHLCFYTKKNKLKILQIGNSC